MADEKTEQKPQQTTPEQPAAPAASEKGGEKGKSSILPYIIVAVIVLVCAGAGVGLGLLFAGGAKTGPAPEGTSEAVKTEEPKKAEHSAKDKQAETQKAGKPGEVWYYDLDPVVANLNEPGATRYVRAVLTLEMSPAITPEKGAAILAQKKPLLTNLMTIYLAGLSVDATRGDKNLKRMQAELTDTFNEKLFPDSAPLVKGILIKEFAVQ
ncbi:MAG: flagellar basal body-associated FliL family protein [Sedimentisphaerales bacterium]